MELIDAKLKTFGHILEQGSRNDSQEDRVIKVPHYQRPYSWDSEMVVNLLSDWQKVHSLQTREDQKKYFAGSMVTAKESSGIQQLIDGQQRFTTIYLLNFIRYLICKVSLREAIYRSSSIRIPTIFSQLIDSAAALFSGYPVVEKRKLEENIVKIYESKEMSQDKKTSEAEKLFFQHFGLPSVSESSDDYFKKYSNLLSNEIKDFGLILQYSRESYNEQLNEALTSVAITLSSQANLSFVKLKVDEKNEENTVIEKYITTLSTIFDFFVEHSISDDPLDKALEIMDLLKALLENIQVCLIRTGNVQDAYILFEVLNDRSMTLSDLDLIKNNFYKTYCLSNSQLSNEDVDREIDERDGQWGDIFGERSTSRHSDKQLIAFIAACYFSGDSDFKVTEKKKQRDKIQKYLDSLQDSYTTETFNRDFNILQAISLVITGFKLPHKSRHKSVLEAEYDLDKSQVYKCIHLLNALEQYGVLAGLVCCILTKIKENSGNDFAPEEAANIVDQLCFKGHKYQDLEELSFQIWRLSIASHNHEIPKAASSVLVENNNVSAKKLQLSLPQELIGSSGSKKLKESFDKLIAKWSYNKRDVKVRVLFARLLYASRNEDGSLQYKKFAEVGVGKEEISQLELDHMEPQKPNNANLESYFGHTDRETFINGVGNMFPILTAENKKKSNNPLSYIFPLLEELNLHRHWLAIEAQKIYEENKDDNGAPTQEFFEKRKTALKQLFWEAINI